MQTWGKPRLSTTLTQRVTSPLLGGGIHRGHNIHSVEVVLRVRVQGRSEGIGDREESDQGLYRDRNVVGSVVAYGSANHVVEGIPDVVVPANELSLATPAMEEM